MNFKIIYIGFLFLFIGTSLFAQDQREKNHSISIIPFNDMGIEKYYISWSSSSGSDDGWQHDIYNQIISFDAEGILNYNTEAVRFIGTGYDEAQEPVQVAINTNNNIMLSVWEDGSGSTVDIRGEMHYPDGTIIKNNWVIDGGIESQHSPDVEHLRNCYLVSLTDEAPPAQTSMNVIQVLDDSTGELIKQLQLSPIDKDQWWTVLKSDNHRFTFAGWGDGESLFGSVIKVGSNIISKTDAKFYISNIDQYYYSFAWLDNISKFIAIAKVNENSAVCLIDTNGVRSNFKTILNAPITRETDLAVRFDSVNNKYQIIYTSGLKDLAMLSVSNNSIELTQLLKDVSNNINWTTTGISCKFIKENTGKELWDLCGKLLVAYNDDNSNNAIYRIISVRDLTNVDTAIDIEILEEYKLYPAYPNPFNPTTTIKYSIPNNLTSKMQKVKIIVCDMLGRKVATLVNKEQMPGDYEVMFNSSNYGIDLTSGVYFYRFECGNFAKSEKLILLK
jgi:hypothetical protein